VHIAILTYTIFWSIIYTVKATSSGKLKPEQAGENRNGFHK